MNLIDLTVSRTIPAPPWIALPVASTAAPEYC